MPVTNISQLFNFVQSTSIFAEGRSSARVGADGQTAESKCWDRQANAWTGSMRAAQDPAELAAAKAPASGELRALSFQRSAGPTQRPHGVVDEFTHDVGRWADGGDAPDALSSP